MSKPSNFIRLAVAISTALIFSSLFLFVFFPANTTEAKVQELPAACSLDVQVYVNENAAGTYSGISWTDAFTDLQTALSIPTDGPCSADSVEIWVASGVYTPGTTRTDSFVLTDNISVYGGFAGTETVRSERDWESNVTVLSGDIAGDDTVDGDGLVANTDDINGSNSQSVVTSSGVTTTAVLDGFYITAGYNNAAFSGWDNFGAGLFNNAGHPTLENLVFIGNYAEGGGGGIFSVDGELSLNNITFKANQAQDDGGGMSNYRNPVSLINVQFEDNYSAGSGGGLSNYRSDIELSNTIFRNNASDNKGGAVFNEKLSTAQVISSTFEQNDAEGEGGGIFNEDTLTMTLASVDFISNTAESGGAMYSENSTITLQTVNVISNTAVDPAGGIYNEETLNTLIDVVFEKNRSTDSDGGAIYNYYDSHGVFNNVTFRNNHAVNNGGAFVNSDASNAQLTNVLFEYNSAGRNGGGIYNESGDITIGLTNFISNTADEGGAIYNDDIDIAVITQTTIIDNAARNGGGIFNKEVVTATLTNVNVISNTATQVGGGLYNDQGDAIATNLLITNNSAGSNGGGVHVNSGTVIISRSVVADNLATESGGGLYARGTLSILNVSGTTISNNTANTVRGGGLYIREGSTAYVTNSTISGNQATATNGLTGDAGNGGGIYVGGPIASYLTLNHVTITDNEAAGNGGGLDINRDDIGDVITITSSIIAGNTDVGGYPDCHAYGTSSYNLVIDSTNLFGGTAGDDCQPDTSDLSLNTLGVTITTVLQPLANNDGITAGNPLSATHKVQTHSLAQNSPALDASDSSLTTDQRGKSRPSGDKNDIGAFEAESRTLGIEIVGFGSVSDGELGINCSSDCSNQLVEGTVVTLTATADPGYTFTGWSESCTVRNQVCRTPSTDACSGTGICVVTMEYSNYIVATFEQSTYSLFITTEGEGSGTVTKSPDMPTYTYGTIVTLTATADQGSVFAGWSEGCPPRSSNCNPVSISTCSGAETCILTVTSFMSIVATFDLDTDGLNHPPDGGVVETTTPEFDWEGAFEDPSDIISYTVIITNSDGVTYTFATTNTTIVPDSGLPAGTYEWTVVGKMLDGSTIEASQIFTFTIDPVLVFLPFVSLNTAPVCETAVQLAEGIPRRSTTTLGETFYTSSLDIPDVSYGCSVYLSSSSSEISPILVDDVLQLWVGSNLIFEHNFSQTGSLVEENITLPQSAVEQLESQTVTIVLSDVYGFSISSTDIYLISN